jgi:hypothetical protein
MKTRALALAAMVALSTMSVGCSAKKEMERSEAAATRAEDAARRAEAAAGRVESAAARAEAAAEKVERLMSKRMYK